MKVVAFNGSARKAGNTSILMKRVLDKLHAADIETEYIELAGQKVKGCIACYKCFENKDMQCAVKKDHFNEYFEKIVAADGVVLGSPVYFTNVSAEMKGLIDRTGLVSMANGRVLGRKVGAAVVAARRGGGVQTMQAINALFLHQEMIVPGSIYWNMAYGKNIGEVESDAEGLDTMDKLGENMAWLLTKIAS
jgi:multimeric flavodoxin WrbA